MLFGLKMGSSLTSPARFAQGTAGVAAVFRLRRSVAVTNSTAFGINAANGFQTDRRLQSTQNDAE